MSIASRIAREIHEDDMDKFSYHTETPHKLSADAEQLIEQYVRPASQSSGSTHDRYGTSLHSLYESNNVLPFKIPIAYLYDLGQKMKI